MLNLSCNLGLITGASVLASVFACAGMRLTFAVAALLIMSVLGPMAGLHGVSRQTSQLRFALAEESTAVMADNLRALDFVFD